MQNKSILKLGKKPKPKPNLTSHSQCKEGEKFSV